MGALSYFNLPHGHAASDAGRRIRVDGVDLPSMSKTGDADDSLASWCADEEWCAITRGAQVLGKKWHPVIVHRLLDGGPLGFNRLQERVDGISSTVLSDSLDDLEEKGIVDRSVICESPYRVEYSLTERGRDLGPVIGALEAWGREHLEAPACQ